MTADPDFKGSPLFDVEHLRNDTRQFLIESPDDLTKYIIADDPE